MKTEVGKYAPILPLLKKLKEEEKVKEIEEEEKEYKKCLKKGQYSKKIAQTIKNSLRREGRIVRMYHCPLCNYWHVTHLVRKKVKFQKKKNNKRLKTQD